jgi:ankyrin repeat protein
MAEQQEKRREQATAALFEAIRRGSLDETREALAAGADPGASAPYQVVIDRSVYDGSWTPLSLAADLGHLSLVELLLVQAGVNVDAVDAFAGATALMQAAKRGHVEIVNRLLDRGANPNLVESYDRCTAAAYAVRAGHEAIALRVIEAGTDLERFGPSLLVDAVYRRRIEIINWLLAHGVSPQARNQVGESARDVAAEANDRALLDLLGQEAPDHIGPDELFQAVVAEDLAVLRRAIRVLSDLDSCRDNEGLTPLSLAVSRGKHDAARILLCGGADPNLTDREGRDALTLARARGHESVAKMLENGPPY